MGTLSSPGRVSLTGDTAPLKLSGPSLHGTGHSLTGGHSLAFSSLLPAKIADLTAGSATETTQPLSWAADALATTYEVQFSVSGFGRWGLPLDAGTTTSYEALSLIPGTSYDYRVRGVNGVGAGPWSDVVTNYTTTRNPLPAVPNMVARYRVPPGYAGSEIPDLSGNGLHLERVADSDVMVGRNAALIGPMRNGDVTVVCVQKITSIPSDAEVLVPWSIGSSLDELRPINTFHFENPTSELPETAFLVRCVATNTGKLSVSVHAPPVLLHTVCRFDKTNRVLKIDLPGATTSETLSETDYVTGTNAWDQIVWGSPGTISYELIVYASLATDLDVIGLQTYTTNEYGT